MNQDKGKKIFIFLIILFIAISLVFTLLSLIVNKNFLLRFSEDKELTDSTIKNIKILQIFSSFFGTLFLTLSVLMLYFKDKLISFFEKKKNFFQGILMLFLLIFVFLLIGEIVTRIIFYDETSNFGVGPGTLKFNKKYVSLNTEGMRDYEFNITKPENTFRIIVLGDSYAYGFGIKNASNTFPKLLEKELNDQKPFSDYEVFNFGVPGKNTEDELNILINKSLEYSPDLIIIAYVLNDMKNIDSSIDTSSYDWITLPYIGFWLREISYLYFYLETSFNQISRKIRTNSSYEEFLLNVYDSEKNQDYNEKIFKNLSKISEENDFEVMVVVFPLAYKFEDYPFLEVHEQIEEISKEQDFIFLDLLEPYKNYKESELIVSRYDSHPNEIAHKIASDLIYEKLINEKII